MIDSVVLPPKICHIDLYLVHFKSLSVISYSRTTLCDIRKSRQLKMKTVMYMAKPGQHLAFEIGYSHRLKDERSVQV